MNSAPIALFIKNKVVELVDSTLYKKIFREVRPTMLASLNSAFRKDFIVLQFYENLETHYFPIFE